MVDNDIEALDLACTDLRLEGHEIVGTAQDGRQAIAVIEATTPDVVVLDHRMPPGPHGLEVARRITTDHPHIRVILYSNYQDADLIRDTRALGAAFLPKGNLRRLRSLVIG